MRFRKDPLAYLESTAREFGDVAYWKLGRQKLFLINHPDLIRDVLVTDSDNFTKEMKAARKLLGRGLTTSDGELHRRQRRIVQPSFRQGQIAAFAETMIRHAEHARARWRDGATLDLAHEMGRLTLAVVGETLFGADLEPYTDDVRAALAATIGSPPNMLLPIARFVEKLPLPTIRRMKAGRAKLDEIVYGLINDRRASGAEHDDLLSILLLAQDEDGHPQMTDQQVRDEVMNFLIAGHETTANALSWTWYLLSQHPDVEIQLHQELDRVLAGRSPTLADMAALPFTENVIRESLRLYPPLWMIWRRAINDYELNGYVAPAGSIIIISQHVTHRDARHFSEPLRFNPNRWTEEFKERLPKYAFFPFGGGPRQCIGDRFGFMEAILTLAIVAQEWQFRLIRGHPVIPQPLLTLRPKYGLRMTALRR